MKIDLLKYSNNKQTVVTYLKNNQSLSFQDKMTNISLFTNMPLVVVAYFIAKIEGESDEFTQAVARLTKFYKYDEILNIKEFMLL